MIYLFMCNPFKTKPFRPVRPHQGAYQTPTATPVNGEAWKKIQQRALYLVSILLSSSANCSWSCLTSTQAELYIASSSLIFVNMSLSLCFCLRKFCSCLRTLFFILASCISVLFFDFVVFLVSSCRKLSTENSFLSVAVCVVILHWKHACIDTYLYRSSIHRCRQASWQASRHMLKRVASFASMSDVFVTLRQSGHAQTILSRTVWRDKFSYASTELNDDTANDFQ